MISVNTLLELYLASNLELEVLKMLRALGHSSEDKIWTR